MLTHAQEKGTPHNTARPSGVLLPARGQSAAQMYPELRIRSSLHLEHEVIAGPEDYCWTRPEEKAREARKALGTTRITSPVGMHPCPVPMGRLGQGFPIGAPLGQGIVTMPTEQPSTSLSRWGRAWALDTGHWQHESNSARARGVHTTSTRHTYHHLPKQGSVTSVCGAAGNVPGQAGRRI